MRNSRTTIIALGLATAASLSAQRPAQSPVASADPAHPSAAMTPVPPFDFSIRNIMRGPELYGTPPSDVRWSADSRWIYFT